MTATEKRYELNVVMSGPIYAQLDILYTVRLIVGRGQVVTKRNGQ